MHDEQDPSKRSLSEISHLFLSSVRDRQTGGTPRPRRTPPPKAAVSIDLSPEEYAQVFAAGETHAAAAHAPQVTAVIGAHLDGSQVDRVREYARHLAGRLGRVGLIELDASEFRLMCFDPSGVDRPDAPAEAEFRDGYEPRQMAEALNELNCDVNHWLLLASAPRTPEARVLLREVDRWVLLSTCDHDGVVASYRLLKGLSEGLTHRPEMALALLDTRDEAEVERVNQKLAGVCRQFLGVDLGNEGPVNRTARVAEHLVLCCRPTHDKAMVATAPQWEIVAQFLAQSRATRSASLGADAGASSAEEEINLTMESMEVPVCRELVADMVIPAGAASSSAPADPAAAFPRAASAVPPQAQDLRARHLEKQSMTEVIDLCGGDATPDAVLTAILREPESGLIECPVRPPMCSEARLAVTRDRSLLLLAATQTGLGNLRAIGQAHRWLVENRALVAMALPQLTIDSARLPRLRLIVDQADMRADLLQPMLQSGQVEVQAFRRLSWGGKTGLYLEAA